MLVVKKLLNEPLKSQVYPSLIKIIKEKTIGKKLLNMTVYFLYNQI